ncbi:MAG: VWA domain-containing protein [Deltaproteobacteria bacterium]|nr:VWA domain-containing protein [Deltaproteobacteria bacterium]
MNLHDFHFLRPWWLLALPAGLLLLAGRKRRDPGKSQWHKVCDSHLLKHLLVGEAQVEQKRIYCGLLLMLALASLALAGPAWERRPQPLFRAASGRVIVLDLSLSMDTPDITPSRLSRARYKAIDLIKAGVGREQGLVVFAGDSFIVTPLTDDQATLLNLLPGLSTGTVPVQGSRADRGLEKAGELLERAAIRQGQIILLADDADARTITAAGELRKAGQRIDVIAVGTENGAPVPLADGSYLKNGEGQIVVPVPAFDQLQAVAKAGGGIYLKIDDPAEAFQPLNQNSALFPENKSQSELTGDQWLDRGPWLLLPLLFLAALCFRKGWLLLILITLFINPAPAAAQDWEQLWHNLWQRPSQQAAKAFNEKDFAKAAQLSRDPDWQAAADYRAGKFKEAAAALEKRASAQAQYNRGNALARAEKLEEALKAYDQALQNDPNLEDARFNRDLVEKVIKEQQQQNSQDSQKSQNDDSAENNQENQDQQKQDQQQQDQESQEQQGQQSDQNSKGQNSKNQETKSQNSPKQSSPEQSSQEPTQQQKQPEKEPEKAETDNPAEQANADSAKASTSPEEKAQKPETAKDEARQAVGQEKKEPEKEQPENQAVGVENDEKPLDAKEQVLEQWLRRVPDDPQGLLQRKFLYQYRDRQNRSQGNKDW